VSSVATTNFKIKKIVHKHTYKLFLSAMNQTCVSLYVRWIPFLWSGLSFMR